MLDLLARAAFVAVVATLISESMIMTPLRDRVKSYFISCPICMGFWLALPNLYYGLNYYCLVVAVANAWMLLILKLYNELEKGN